MDAPVPVVREVREPVARESTHLGGNGHQSDVSGYPVIQCPLFLILWGRVYDPSAERNLDILCPPARRLVFRPSTRAEITYIFSRLKHHRRSVLSRLRHAAVDLLKIGFHPCHA